MRLKLPYEGISRTGPALSYWCKGDEASISSVFGGQVSHPIVAMDIIVVYHRILSACRWRSTIVLSLSLRTSFNNESLLVWRIQGSSTP